MSWEDLADSQRLRLTTPHPQGRDKLTPEEIRVIEEAAAFIKGAPRMDPKNLIYGTGHGDKLLALLERNQVTEAQCAGCCETFPATAFAVAAECSYATGCKVCPGCGFHHHPDDGTDPSQPPQEAPREWTLRVCDDGDTGCGYVEVDPPDSGRACTVCGWETRRVRVAELPPEEGK